MGAVAVLLYKCHTMSVFVHTYVLMYVLPPTYVCVKHMITVQLEL